MSIIKIPTVFNIDLEFEAADLGRRGVAYLIDLLIRGAYFWLVAAMLGKMGVDFEGAANIFIYIILIFPIVFYYLLSEMIMKGQSLGKRVMDIKVVSLMGNVPSLSQVLLRWMFRLLESPLLSLSLLAATLEERSPFAALAILAVGIMPLVVLIRSPYNQRLGDIAAGTILVRTKERHTIQDTIFRDVAHADYVPTFPQTLRLSDRDLSKIKSVLDNAARSKDTAMAERISYRIKDVLHIQSDLDAITFLETLLNDYNYLVTRK